MQESRIHIKAFFPPRWKIWLCSLSQWWDQINSELLNSIPNPCFSVYTETPDQMTTPIMTMSSTFDWGIPLVDVQCSLGMGKRKEWEERKLNFLVIGSTLLSVSLTQEWKHGVASLRGNVLTLFLGSESVLVCHLASRPNNAT